MRYRGFNISISKEGETVLCKLFAAEDVDHQFPLDEFDLSIDQDVSDISDHSIAPYAVEYIDSNILELILLREETKNTIMAMRLNSAACIISENRSEEELYEVLRKRIGLTDDEIREIGLASLAPYFDRDAYAEVIAAFLTDEGIERTTSGTWTTDFDEINKRFGVSLPEDKNLLDKIMCSFDPEMVEKVNTMSDISITFHLDYCPYAEHENRTEESLDFLRD
mgnify:CR=1 FL=1